MRCHRSTTRFAARSFRIFCRLHLLLSAALWLLQIGHTDFSVFTAVAEFFTITSMEAGHGDQVSRSVRAIVQFNPAAILDKGTPAGGENFNG